MATLRPAADINPQKEDLHLNVLGQFHVLVCLMFCPIKFKQYHGTSKGASLLARQGIRG